MSCIDRCRSRRSHKDSQLKVENSLFRTSWRWHMSLLSHSLLLFFGMFLERETYTTSHFISSSSCPTTEILRFAGIRRDKTVQLTGMTTFCQPFLQQKQQQKRLTTTTHIRGITVRNIGFVIQICNESNKRIFCYKEPMRFWLTYQREYRYS